MAEMEETGGLLDGILAVTHPELYRVSQELIRNILAEGTRASEVMRLWPTSFNSVQFIINRLSLLHRDKNTRAGWVDLLLTLGTYGQKALLELHNLGVSVPYDSGTIAVLCSRVIRHGVARVEGDRLCYALYMVENVHTHFGMSVPGFAHINEVCAL